MKTIKNTAKVVREKTLEFNLSIPEHKDMINAVGKALSSPVRIDILNLIKITPLSLQEISKSLDLPLSSTAMHIKYLEEAHLIITENQPGIHGSMRVCMCNFLSFHLESFDAKTDTIGHTILMDMPVGNYTDFRVEPTCGLAGLEGIIDSYDNPAAFYSVDRQKAQLIWFNNGFIEYRFPNKTHAPLVVKELSFSLELCSEAPGYCDVWPSDITFSINDCEIGTYTSPGDFGIRRGKLTPAIWPSGRTQYGLLTTVSVKPDGGYINEILVNKQISLNKIHLEDSPYISFKIQIKEDAKNKGGINIFGSEYGDYPQGICLRIIH